MSSSHITKGDVVMVDVPYLDASRTVRRPSLVVCDTSQMLDVVIAAISSRIRHPLPTAHYKIDRGHPDWNRSGLRLDSVIRCDRIFTIHHSQIHRSLGSLSVQTLTEIDVILKTVLRIA